VLNGCNGEDPREGGEDAVALGVTLLVVGDNSAEIRRKQKHSEAREEDDDDIVLFTGWTICNGYIGRIPLRTMSSSGGRDPDAILLPSDAPVNVIGPGQSFTT